MNRLAWTVALLIWLFAMARPWGALPALGPLFDLKSGIWQHHDFKWQSRSLKGLRQPVFIAIDRNDVPHFFAQNESDLYLAQGFAAASLRLFQMDLSSRSTTGRISELVGAKGLGLDRFFIQFGMREAELAQRELLMSDSVTRDMIESYLSGVNQYIDQLVEFPIEYKLLGQRPQRMTPAMVSGMAKAMTYALSGGSQDLVMSHLAQQISVEKILDLFPEFLPSEFEDFVIPEGPGVSRRHGIERPDLFSFHTHLRNLPAVPRPPSFNGSNNWAVSPQKSKTGHSILANDTHLGLSLPNVWLEMQLSCPSFNVYGVGFPAIPGIVNGFNRDVAWGPTNGTTNVLNHYEIEFESETSWRYRDLRGQWTDSPSVREELISARGGAQVVEVHRTIWGPVLYREGKFGLVARWTGHDPSNELKVLRQLYSQKTARRCLDEFANWQVPIQNFICVDADHIGLVHAGHVPERKVGEGRFISPPEQTLHELGVYLPAALRPSLYDPNVGYVRSANQRVWGPSAPHDMGWSYEDPFRGRRIRNRLEAQEKWSGEDMMDLQNDDYSLEAETILPALLKALDVKALTSDQIHQLEDLKKWDFHVRADSVPPTLYKAWYRQLKKRLFEDEWSLPESPRLTPKDMRIALLLQNVLRDPHHPDSFWVDDKRTPEIENLMQVVTSSWIGAWQELVVQFGDDSSAWQWQRYNQTQLSHVAKLPGFGSGILSMSGASDSVRGNRGWHGAVYKFVIEMGPKIRAWMQVPGGADGDPLSPHYERFVKEWAKGEMHEVEFYHDLTEARARAVKVVELTPMEAP